MYFSISTSGIILALSYLLGVFLFWRWGRKEGFSSDDLFDLVLVSSLGALAGGKLPPLFVEMPADFFWVGAILAGATALLIFSSFKRWSFLRILGLAALALSFSEATVFLGFGLLRTQSFLFAAGTGGRALLLYFLHQRTSPGTTFFLYLILEGVLLYLSSGFLSLALLGAGIIGLIAITVQFKLKRSDG
ncbi:MAG TPA: hypothetical protein VI794_00755 [Patescibacteria group bacterium]|nr:hypothetical protein [Patescibacteria group bacterium]